MDADGISRRRGWIPPMRYPVDLPILERRQDLLDTITANPVVVVSGETGSGKSTQLPKICLEAGFGARGWIGHTQPRRVAAFAIAERVASELGTELGDLVGHKVRFDQSLSPRTLVKIMTDGILLAEIEHDPELRRYETIIVDEAHERSLNIDFLLGYLRRLTRIRRDLKVIITSATIDTERFARYFDDAPIVKVGGKSHLVELRYRPEPDQIDAIESAVRELLRDQSGDILVFCSGESEIREAADRLRRSLPALEVLELFARLGPAEQRRVFTTSSSRRVIVATNIAETSLTVPGVRCVVDAGTARISRFNRRTKVQRLPIEPISRASADQRAGRCGRLGPGVCIRLYDKDDYLARPKFTEPEILRTNLASVILQMSALGLGNPSDFGFIDPPPRRAVRDGIRLLEELDAVDPGREGTAEWLTPLGRQLAEVPIDPRLGRMLLAADDFGCVRELLIIVAGLSIQDPRVRPSDPDANRKASGLHARFADSGSDFVAMVALWEHLNRSARSRHNLRRLCSKEYLHHRRVREWQDVHAQLRRSVKAMGLTINTEPAQHDVVHRAVLAGLLSRIGCYDPRQRVYRGTHGGRFVLVRDGALAGRTPGWVMAAEMVETERVLARVCASIDESLIESAASHLLRRDYYNPRWHKRRGIAVCNESATLFGLRVVDNRTVALHRVDPSLARQLLVRHAILEGANALAILHRESLDRIEALRTRLRRDDLIPNVDELVDRYEASIPAHIVSEGDLIRWWQSEPQPHRFTPEEWLEVDLGEVNASHPTTWPFGDIDLRIDYRFEPGAADDGITIEIPLHYLSRMSQTRFEWLVPGMRPHLIEAMFATLPKPVRRLLSPITEAANNALALVDPDADVPATQQLAHAATRLSQVKVWPGHLSTPLPSWLRPHYRVVDNGHQLGIHDDLSVLKDWFRDRVPISRSPDDLEQAGLTTFPVRDLPAVVISGATGRSVRSYPALVDDKDSVSVRLLSTEAEQAEAMWAGTRRLLLLQRPSVGDRLRRVLTPEFKALITTSVYRSPSCWFSDCLVAAGDELLGLHGGPVHDRESYQRLSIVFRRDLPDAVLRVAQAAAVVLRCADRLRSAVDGAGSFSAAVTDIGEQLDRLVYEGFVSAVGADRLDDVARYLRAAHHRVRRLPQTSGRDQSRMVVVRTLEAEHDQLVAQTPLTVDLENLSWQIQELRVSLFAQPVGAKGTISAERITRAMQRIRGEVIGEGR